MINHNHIIGWRGYILWGVLVYLGFLVTYLPVGWLYAHLAAYAPPIQWTQLHGTPWSGQAKQVSVGPITFGPLRWQLLWRELLAGRLSMELQLGNGSELSGQVIVGMLASTDINQRILFLEKGKLLVSLSWLTAQLAFLPPGSSGQMHVTLDSLVLDVDQEHLQQLQGTAELTNIRIGSPINLLLGGFRLQAQRGEAGNIRVAIQDRQATVRIKATLKLHSNGHYRIRGTLAPQDAMDKRMISLLRLIGQPGLDGRMGLDYSGVLAF